MKKPWAVLATVVCLLVLVSLAFAGCGGGEEDDGLIGVWTDQEGFLEYEFTSDGTLVLRFMGEEEQVPYTVEGGKLIVDDPETGEPAEAEYTVEGDTLTIVADGEKETLVRKTGTTTEAAESAGDAAESETAGSGRGTRENPVLLSQEAQVGDWNVAVVSVTLDATASIVDEDEFSDPPQEGSQYVLATVDATYTGTESSTFWMDVTMKFVGGKGNTFGSPEGFAVPPNPLWNVEEAFTGASITGDALFEVPSDQVSGGVLMLEPSFSVEGSRVFFSIE